MKEIDMNRNDHRKRTGLLLSGLVAVIALGQLLDGGPALGQAHSRDGRLTREIGVMEGIVDQVLLDSKNLLVSGRDNTRGLYLDEFGAVFTFDASLVGGSMGGLRSLSMLKGDFSFLAGKDGSPSVRFLRGNKDLKALRDSEYAVQAKAKDLEAKARELDKKAKQQAERDEEMKDEESKKSGDSSTDEDEPGNTVIVSHKNGKIKIHSGGEEFNLDDDSESDPATLYKNGKAEIIQALMDYGDTMRALRDDQTIAFAAFLHGSDYFTQNKISRLVLRAKVRDLREFAAGRITEQEMRSRIVEEEF
jgi:hypothetical protein